MNVSSKLCYGRLCGVSQYARFNYVCLRFHLRVEADKSSHEEVISLEVRSQKSLSHSNTPIDSWILSCRPCATIMLSRRRAHHDSDAFNDRDSEIVTKKSLRVDGLPRLTTTRCWSSSRSLDQTSVTSTSENRLLVAMISKLWAELYRTRRCNTVRDATCEFPERLSLAEHDIDVHQRNRPTDDA